MASPLKGTHGRGSPGRRVCLAVGMLRLRWRLFHTCLSVVLGQTRSLPFLLRCALMKGAWPTCWQQLRDGWVPSLAARVLSKVAGDPFYERIIGGRRRYLSCPSAGGAVPQRMLKASSEVSELAGPGRALRSLVGRRRTGGEASRRKLRT